ncbi:MAG: hypothetical protein MI810_06065 [Flavobacteriales bacterium]|nr:hypothetical protein [Flavobacteriales bacterium]
MNLKLIPVIELVYADEGIDTPGKGPYWTYPDEWDQYHADCYQSAGFEDPFTPFDPGSPLYEAAIITDSNLTKIIRDHIVNWKKGEEFEREQASPLFGGYVLQIDDQNLFYPQCCGDLGDIQFWRNIARGQASFYEGHPAPMVTFEGNNILFDLKVDEFNEEFTPTPIERNFQFKKNVLKTAIEETESILDTFADRIQLINEKEKLEIENIDALLVWENVNYQ